MLLKYGGAVDENGEYKENERFADQMEKGAHELTEKNKLPRISEVFCMGVRVELHELSIGSNLPQIQDCFS